MPNGRRSLSYHLPKPTAEESAEGPAAIDEAAAVKAGLDLSSRKELSTLKQLDRSENYEDHLHYIIIGITYLFVFLAGAMLLTVVYQMVVPDKFRYLTQDETNQLEHFLFSGVFGGFVTALWKRAGIKTNSDDD
jgi:hypothetical protein